MLAPWLCRAHLVSGSSSKAARSPSSSGDGQGLGLTQDGRPRNREGAYSPLGNIWVKPGALLLFDNESKREEGSLRYLRAQQALQEAGCELQ